MAAKPAPVSDTALAMTRSCVQQIRIPKGSKQGTCRVQCEHFSMDITYQVDGEELKLSIQKPLLKKAWVGKEVSTDSQLENSSTSLTRSKRHRGASDTRSQLRCCSHHRKSKGKSKRPKQTFAEKIHTASSINMISCVIEKPKHHISQQQSSRDSHELLSHSRDDARKPGRKPGLTDIGAHDDTSIDTDRATTDDTTITPTSSCLPESHSLDKRLQKRSLSPKKYRNVSVMVKPVGENLLLDGMARKSRKHKHRTQQGASSFCAEQLVQVARLLNDGQFRKKLLKDEADDRKEKPDAISRISDTSDELAGEAEQGESVKPKRPKKKKLSRRKLKQDENNDEELSDKLLDPVEIERSSPILKQADEPTEKRNDIEEIAQSGVSSTSKDETVTSSNIVDDTLKICASLKSLPSQRSVHTESLICIETPKSPEAIPDIEDIPIVSSQPMEEPINEIQPIAVTSTDSALGMDVFDKIMVMTEFSDIEMTIESEVPKVTREEQIFEQDSLDILPDDGKNLHRCISGTVVNNGRHLHDCRELQRTLNRTIKSVKSCVHESCQSSFTYLDDDSYVITKYISEPITLEESRDENAPAERIDLPEGTLAEDNENLQYKTVNSLRQHGGCSSGMLSKKPVAHPGLFPASLIAIQKCSKLAQRKMKLSKRSDRINIEYDYKDLARSCPSMMGSHMKNDSSLSQDQVLKNESLLDDSSEYLAVGCSITSSEEREIRNWSENNVSNISSPSCFNDTSTSQSMDLVESEQTTKTSQSQMSQDKQVNDAGDVSNASAHVLGDSDETLALPSSSTFETTDSDLTKNESSSPLTNVVVMQCMVPQNLAHLPTTNGIAQKLRKNTYQNGILKHSPNHRDGIVSKVLQCDGFSIIVDEDQRNHQCKVVFAPSKPNVLTSYIKHDDVGTQVVASTSSHIELKPVCAFVTTPMSLVEEVASKKLSNAVSFACDRQDKSEKGSPDRDSGKPIRKCKHRRAPHKPGYEGRNKPHEVVKRRHCKSSRYIDKVIHDLSVNPIIIKEEGNEEKDIVEITEEKKSSNACCGSGKAMKTMANKTTMPDFNIDAAHEKKFNCQGTMPDFNIDCEDGDSPRSENGPSPGSVPPIDPVAEKESHVSDVGVQMDPEDPDLMGMDIQHDEPIVEEEPHRLSAEIVADELTSIIVNKTADFQSSSDERSSVVSESSRATDTPSPPIEKRTTSISISKGNAAEFLNSFIYMDQNNDSPKSSGSPGSSSENSKESQRSQESSGSKGSDSKDSSKTMEPESKQGWDSEILFGKERSEVELEIPLVTDMSHLTPEERVKCKKYLGDNRPLLDISPQKFAECFQQGLESYPLSHEAKTYCDEGSIRLHHNIKVADFFLALGHSADDCYRMGKDVTLCAYLKCAMNEAMIWTHCLTNSQGSLILRLSDEARCFPHVKQYFLRLAEAIANNRIESDLMLDSFLNLITFMETGHVSRKSMMAYENSDGSPMSSKRSSDSNRVYATFMMLKKSAEKKATKILTQKEDALLRDLAQQALMSSRLKTSQCKMIARYIGAGKITYKFRLKAAIDFMEIQNKTQIDMREFERHCGITTEQLENRERKRKIRAAAR